MAPFLLFIVLLPAFPAFWLGKNSEGGPVSSTIVGLFDTVRTLTKGVGGIVDQVEEGFDEIRNDEEEGEISLKLEVVLDDNNSSSPTNSSGTSGLGSKLVIGIFDALQDLTSDVGRLVGTVEEVLGNKRGDVVKLADRVEENVDQLQTRLGDWVNNLTNTDSSGVTEVTSWRVVHISKKNSTSSDWEEPTMVEQSVLANSSKFIEGPWEKEESDLANSSSVVKDQRGNITTLVDFTNSSTVMEEPLVEPTVVEQSVLANSSGFIQIASEENEEQQNDGSLFSEVKVGEEEELEEDIVLE